MIDTSSNPFSGSFGQGNGTNIEEFIRKYTTINQQPMVNPSPISELDEFLAGLPSDKRQAVELSNDYQINKSRLFEKFLTYLVAMTPDGNNFINTPSGRKLAQELLDSAQVVAKSYERTSRNELQEMKDLIRQQSNEIESLKEKLINASFTQMIEQTTGTTTSVSSSSKSKKVKE